MSDSELALSAAQSFPAPFLIERAGPSTKKKFFEFFTVPIRNANTRAAYYRAIQQFLGWVERAGCRSVKMKIGTHAELDPHRVRQAKRAIGEAIGQRRSRERPLPIGSVKSQVGHLEAASGMAGLIKVLHVLRHRCVPANIHLEQHPCQRLALAPGRGRSDKHAIQVRPRKHDIGDLCRRQANQPLQVAVGIEVVI